MTAKLVEKCLPDPDQAWSKADTFTMTVTYHFINCTIIVQGDTGKLTKLRDVHIFFFYIQLQNYHLYVIKR